MKADHPKVSRAKFADWARFETFGDGELSKAVDCAAEWYDALSAQLTPRWLSILGPSGTGKTHLASALWRWAHRKLDFSATEYNPAQIYWPDFVQRLRGGEAFGMRNDMKRWPVLFLDDIGAERDSTGFASEELNTLLGCRVGKWTLITSNLSFDSLNKAEGRIASRLIRSPNICVNLKTLDYSERQ